MIFVAAVMRPDREGITVSIALTVFGIVWIGVPFAHAVLLRELPDHGAALLVDVLVATFVADTAAYAGGRLFGRHRLAPDALAEQDPRGARLRASSAARWASGSPGSTRTGCRASTRC